MSPGPQGQEWLCGNQTPEVTNQIPLAGPGGLQIPSWPSLPFSLMIGSPQLSRTSSSLSECVVGRLILAPNFRASLDAIMVLNAMFLKEVRDKTQPTRKRLRTSVSTVLFPVPSVSSSPGCLGGMPWSDLHDEDRGAHSPHSEVLVRSPVSVSEQSWSQGGALSPVCLTFLLMLLGEESLGGCREAPRDFRTCLSAGSLLDDELANLLPALHEAFLQDSCRTDQ